MPYYDTNRKRRGNFEREREKKGGFSFLLFFSTPLCCCSLARSSKSKYRLWKCFLMHPSLHPFLTLHNRDSRCEKGCEMAATERGKAAATLAPTATSTACTTSSPTTASCCTCARVQPQLQWWGLCSQYIPGIMRDIEEKIPLLLSLNLVCKKSLKIEKQKRIEERELRPVKRTKNVREMVVACVTKGIR